MKKTTIKAALIMSVQDLEAYNTLPDNLPETTLNKAQQDLVWALYNKYISKQIDNQRGGWSMYEIEKQERWPSGNPHEGS